MNTYITQDNEPLVSFVKQLSSANISLTRFLEAETGKKKPAGTWKNTAHHPDNVGRDSLIKSGDGLLIVDIDDWDSTSQSVKELIKSNPTLTVQSPHATGKEGHYYYQIDESPFQKNEHSPDWGEVKYGALTVTPGSEVHGLRNGKDCSEGCCTQADPGRYTIRHHRPIHQITQNELPEIFDSDTSETVSSKDTVLSESFNTHPTETEAPEFNPQKRLEYGRKHSETLDKLCGWANQNGNPEKIGYSGRSEAERALSMCLAYWYERNTTAVQHTLNILNPPKWAQRDDNYKDSVLEAIELQPDTFDQIDTGPSGPSEELTLSVWLDLFTHESMSTKEVAESVEYGERQTRKALNWLDDNGYINYERDGRSSRWSVNEGSQDPLDEAENELNSIETMEQYLK